MKFDNLINSKQTAIKLHESELRFKTVFEEASDGILIVDIQSMKFKYANPAICKMLGYASKDLQKLSIQDIHPKDRLDYVISEFKAQAQGIKKLAEDIPCLKKDGTIFFADINTTPVELSGTKYNMGFFRDISDKKAVGIEKENMQRTIFQASKLASIGQLAAGMSHEINNPLAIIQGYVEIINDEYAHNNSNLRELLKVVEDSIDRIKNTVNGLNTFAISGNESLQIIDLHKILHHCISIVEAIYEKDGTIINKLFNAGKPTIRGNHGILQQAIMNLLSNAKDAIESTSGTIYIESKNDGESIVVTISDNGTGIKKEIMDKIFDNFFTTKPIGQGAGLGLGISQSLLAKLNGTIEVDSEYGIGTSVKITLPCLMENKITYMDHQNTPVPELEGSVLVVDDERAIRSHLCHQLSKIGFMVDHTDNGNKAVEMVKNKNYKYIITDLKMPHMNGGMLIKRIRSLGGAEKIIVMTGEILTDYSSLHRELYRKYADGLLKKPFKEDDIHKVFNSFTE